MDLGEEIVPAFDFWSVLICVTSLINNMRIPEVLLDKNDFFGIDLFDDISSVHFHPKSQFEFLRYLAKLSTC